MENNIQYVIEELKRKSLGTSVAYQKDFDYFYNKFTLDQKLVKIEMNLIEDCENKAALDMIVAKILNAKEGDLISRS